MTLKAGSLFLTSLSCLIAFGCGGGGSIGKIAGGGTTGGSTGTTGGTGGSLGTAAPEMTATFQVNVNTGQVTIVTNNAPGMRAPTEFSGNAIGFTSTVLTNVTGDTGVKSLGVTLTNNSSFSIGSLPGGANTGLRVVFGPITPLTAISSQASFTNVSTFAGSGSGFADGASPKFYEPAGIAIGGNGSLYVADTANQRIRVISQGYTSTLAGNGKAGEVDGPATKAEFNSPYSIAIYTDGSLIVADYGGNRIRRVTTTGVVNTVAGTGAAGSANGAGSAATFTNPTAVAVDPGGNIYVSEASSNRIRKITLSGSPSSSANFAVSSFAGSGAAGLLDGNGTSAEFDKPYGLCSDSSGNIYAADYENNVLRRIDSSANVTTISGTGAAADLDGYGNVAQFDRPIGVAFLNGTVFVSEASGNTVREVVPIPGAGVTSTGWAVMTLAGKAGTAGDANGPGNTATFNNLRYLAASPSSSLYVADLGNNQIRKIAPDTGDFPIGTVGGTGNSGAPVTISNATAYIPSSGLGTNLPYIAYPGPLAQGGQTAQQPWNFVVPSGVTGFQFDVVVESDTSILYGLQADLGHGSPNVDVRTFAGIANQAGYVNGPAAGALFGLDSFQAVDANGIVYVADPDNSAVRRIDLNGNVSTIAGVPGIGVGDADGPGNIATFYQTSGIAVNPAGTELFVSDNNDLVRFIELTGYDPTNPSNWTVSTIAGVQGSTTIVDNATGTTATLCDPSGIAIDPTGQNLYIAEWGGHRIRKMQFTGGDPSVASNWYVSTLAGDNSAFGGASGNVNGQGTSARLAFPRGVCVDNLGNVYFEDRNNEIREISPGGNVTIYSGNGTAGYVDGAAGTAEFHFDLYGWLCSDSAGYLYAADYTNNVIRRISPGGYAETVAGTGSAGSLDGLGSVAEMSLPEACAVSPSGTLYFASQAYSSIRMIQNVVGQSAPPQRVNK